MEKLRTLDVFFCKLSAKCQELFLLHGILNKPYYKLIRLYLDKSVGLSDKEVSFWERFASDDEPFEDWFLLVQKWKFWQVGDEDYLSYALSLVSSLCVFVSNYFEDDLPF